MRTIQTVGLAAVAIGMTLSTGARAQSAACLDGQKLMEQRGELIKGLASNGKKKMTPVQACGKFNALVANGTKLLAWFEQNGSWCNVPDAIKTRVQDDHKQAQSVRGQACTAAAKQRQMEAQAARAARQGGGMPGGFGGNGGDLVSGAMRVPQGAL
ncbi:MAG: hypothetical protein BGP06_16610 [Rhizobiales bacterium 65-9]|nr:hypothetical protein [Hyphomicrobiales bacterium]OJY38077.1 MAG: hypothetical protein BGP06_16610 [Rhizobiales bacterium 65-9]